jgi:hypothetical protein
MFTFPEGFQAAPGQQILFTAKSSNEAMPLIKAAILQLPRPATPPALPTTPVAATPVPATQAPNTPATH